MSATTSFKSKNFAKVTVSTGYDAAATAIVLVAGQVSKLPSDGPFLLVWWDATIYGDPSDDPLHEIVSVAPGGISGNTLTVTRAQEGTSATNKNTANSTYKMCVCPLSIGDEIFVVKTADGTPVNNSTALVADPDIKFDIAANEIWVFQIGLFWSTSVIADLKMDLTGPSSPTFVKYGITGFGPATGTSAAAFSSGTINDFWSQDSEANGQNTILHGCVKNGANAGTIQLRIAQQAAVVGNTYLRSGTYLRARRIK